MKCSAHVEQWLAWEYQRTQYPHTTQPGGSKNIMNRNAVRNIKKLLLDVCLAAVILFVLAPIVANAGTVDPNGIGVPTNNAIGLIAFAIIATIGFSVTNAGMTHNGGGGRHCISVPTAVWALVAVGSLLAIVNPAPVNANAIDNSIGVNNCLIIAYDVVPQTNPAVINTNANNVGHIGMNIVRAIAAINPINTINDPVAIIGPNVPKIANVAPINRNPIAV